MPFDAGTRLGPYQIVAPLGAGGMGEVYRARDTRLDRTVAIKVLTGALAADAESRQRFEQEARAIAALNDPHICTIHDVGHEGDLDYLVLEFLEGTSLADRLKRTGALPVDEALAIAVQIGTALDRAHRAGITHRDLKPGNVMLVPRPGAARPDVKLLDFGLASWTTGNRPSALDASLAATMAPSIMATKPPSATVSNTFSGTVQYMSPEQLDGDAGDQRADIFAFGCVLYEMLAGRKPFEGASVMTVIAAIMSTEPAPAAALQANPLLDHLVRRCLEKDPEARWQSIADVTGELRWVADRPIAEPATAAASKVASKATLAAVALLAAGALAAAVLAMRTRPVAEAALPPLQLEITTPPTDDVAGAISTDGTIVFVANKDNVPMLWVRALDSLESRALPGTEGASFPFWSPDGKSLGFFAENKLKRIEASGGAPIVITDAPQARGGAWGEDGSILFAPGVNAPIKRVPARGGTVATLTTIGSQFGSSHRRPSFLPDGKHFLFNSSLGTPETNGVYVGSLDGSPAARISTDEDFGLYADPGVLLTINKGNLLAYRFDPATLKIEGEPVIVAQGVVSPGVFGTSRTGVLAYRTGLAQVRQLVWVDRKGTVLKKLGEPQGGGIAAPELSPDEQSVALFLHPGAGEDNDVWVFDLARFLGRPITTGPPADAHPFWDPDGSHLIFSSARSGRRGPTRFPANGGPPEAIFPEEGEKRGLGLSMTRDRRYLLTRRDGGKTGVDLVAHDLADRREIAVTQNTGDETEGQFSPDGKWVAFVGTISGRQEVYVQSFPDAGGRAQVSTAGGAQIRWAADGHELFYIAPDSKLMAVAFAVRDGRADPALPQALFQTHLANGNNVVGNKAQFAVSRDGRFLLNTVVESPGAPIVVSVNWMRKLAK